MNDALAKYLGASWKVSLLGYAIAGLMTVQTMVEQGQALPTDADGWMKFGVALLLGLMGHQAKSKDVSNAPIPAPAAVVEAVTPLKPAEVKAVDKAVDAKADEQKSAMNNP